MNLGETIKKLRKQKDITQEQLAEYLNISSQAVSKWETDLSLPDITLIPALANIFDVSADVLLGIDVKNKEKQIEDIISRAEKYCKNNTDTDFEKAITTLREGLKEYPNSYKIMERLMSIIGIVKWRKTTDEALILTNEMIKLGEKILAECTEDRCRIVTLHHLCMAYSSPEVNMTEKAIELAEKLPHTSAAREAMFARLYEGEKKIKQYRANILLYLVHLIKSMENYNRIEKSITINKKIISLIEIMIEDENYGYFGFTMFDNYLTIAFDYAKSNDYDKAIEYLQLSSDNAIRSDTEYEGFDSKYTSLLLKGTQDNFIDFPKVSISLQLLEKMKDSALDPIRENKVFIEIEENLKKYAKNK
jgi:transcriptional regulator with XRE-family HTH domain